MVASEVLESWEPGSLVEVGLLLVRLRGGIGGGGLTNSSVQ